MKRYWGFNMQIEYILDTDIKAFFNKCLSSEKGVEKYKESDLIDFFTVTLPNKYEVDFKLINGDSEASPWLDVVLFDEYGNEITCLPDESYEVDGEYCFSLEGSEDIVIQIK